MRDDLINSLAEGGSLERRKPPARPDRMPTHERVILLALVCLSLLALASALGGL